MQIVGAATGASVPGLSIHGMQFSLPYQTLPNVPMVALHGVISRPLPGADAVLLHHKGDPSNTVCIGVNDARYHLPGLPDGCVGTAHHLGSHILFFDDHIEIQGNGAPINIVNAGQVTISTGSKVRIEGDLEVTGQVTGHADNGPVHLTTHEHTNVLPGGGVSGPPVAGS